MKKIAGVLMILILTVVFAGCETTEGVGRDLKNAGEEIEDAAN